MSESVRRDVLLRDLRSKLFSDPWTVFVAADNFPYLKITAAQIVVEKARLFGYSTAQVQEARQALPKATTERRGGGGWTSDHHMKF
jgi:hypothetical protein